MLDCVSFCGQDKNKNYNPDKMMNIIITNQKQIEDIDRHKKKLAFEQKKLKDILKSLKSDKGVLDAFGYKAKENADNTLTITSVEDVNLKYIEKMELGMNWEQWSSEEMKEKINEISCRCEVY